MPEYKAESLSQSRADFPEDFHTRICWQTSLLQSNSAKSQKSILFIYLVRGLGTK